MIQLVSNEQGQSSTRLRCWIASRLRCSTALMSCDSSSRRLRRPFSGAVLREILHVLVATCIFDAICNATAVQSCGRPECCAGTSGCFNDIRRSERTGDWILAGMEIGRPSCTSSDCPEPKYVERLWQIGTSVELELALELGLEADKMQSPKSPTPRLKPSK